MVILVKPNDELTESICFSLYFTTLLLRTVKKGSNRSIQRVFKEHPGEKGKVKGNKNGKFKLKQKSHLQV